MIFNKRILLVLDGGNYCTEAYNRARLLANKTDCELELLWFGKPSSQPELKEKIKAYDNADQIYRQVQSTELLKTVQQLWDDDHFTLLIKGCDDRHNGESMLTPTDWKLLRHTPCPVLLIKRRHAWHGESIVAAINPLSSKEHQIHHDQSVLRLASFIAHQESAKLQTVVATPARMQMVPELQVQKLIDQRARRATVELMNQLQITTHQLHIGQGPAECWIAQIAGEQDAALVIISSRGRSGLKGALLGNTAEQLLDRLETDVLVLKPGLAEQMPIYH
ncbi:universal stress protein [Amphritea balenae]|uniref:Universal stress protein n=1 Tax=Amphritea balenae TaxID=452629 RepID=A0A3P1SLB9_9GAMM|nr:universal stress protein [Amphritea balenae]RRC97072.1 universal stress protein [Amphritea balenae]GGK67714.1 hypothetical protein GCM10007941_17350 [Amphritea balenae]